LRVSGLEWPGPTLEQPCAKGAASKLTNCPATVTSLNEFAGRDNLWFDPLQRKNAIYKRTRNPHTGPRSEGGQTSLQAMSIDV
ncbi:MAG: hypothetical protein WCQ21_25640, partial [Verrucomicrobiota bacterium]